MKRDIRRKKRYKLVVVCIINSFFSTPGKFPDTSLRYPLKSGAWISSIDPFLRFGIVSDELEIDVETAEHHAHCKGLF